MRLFKRDIFMAQPQRLYRAWMAEMRLPRYRSYFVNDPKLINLVLKERPSDFPKSELISASLASLLGRGVFVSNGALWESQRRIIDPAFEGGRLRHSFHAIQQAALDATTRITPNQIVDVEAQSSLIAADIIFRTLFSIPISNQIAADTYRDFKTYQRVQPLMNLGVLLGMRRIIPWVQSRKAKKAGRAIRHHLRHLTDLRRQQIEKNTAPDDLATKIMTTPDPETGACFSPEDMVDQVAIFFLAGHETSASALSWALYLLALDPECQERVYAEVSKAATGDRLEFSELSNLAYTRNVFKETLRLYPPVPMMVRETSAPEILRERAVKVGSQVVLSPWHLHRHERLWDRPDEFDPDRWDNAETKRCARDAYMPFSNGPRVCPGAGFAMIEGVVLLYWLVKTFEIQQADDVPPIPVAHLTVRSKDGIRLRFIPRR